MKKSLIIGILLVIICLSLLAYSELIERKSYSTNIHDITNKGLKNENEKVYLDATFVAGMIKFDNKNYYVIFGDGVQYLVLIDDTKALDINRYLMNNPEDSYRLTGVTKLIPEGIEENGMKFVKEWLDSQHEEEDHSHSVTKDDFYQYFGYVYLDVSGNNLLLLIVICLTGVSGVLFILSNVIKKFELI